MVVHLPVLLRAGQTNRSTFKTKPVFILHKAGSEEVGFLRGPIREAESRVPEVSLHGKELSLSTLLSRYPSIFNIIMFDRIEALGS